MTSLWRDIKYGFRQFRRNPGLMAIVIVILAVGIGTNTAIFGFLDRFLLRPLPVKKPHELVIVKYQYRYELAQGVGSGFSYQFYRGLREQSEEMFSGLIAHWWGKVKLSVGESEQELLAAPVSSNYFSVLDVKPVIGRAFPVDENQMLDGQPVAVISHRLWQRQFDGDRGVLGRTILIDDNPLTVVGVTPPEFTGTCAGVGPSVYIPLKMWVHRINPSLKRPNRTWLSLLWRPEPGTSHQQAQTVLRVAAERLQAIQHDKPNFPTEMLVADGSRGAGASEYLWRPFALLQVVAVPILLVACANVANMLLARGITRQKEIAIRRAMGAGRSAIIRQLLTESVLLAVLSGACGVILAHWLGILLRGALTEASTSNTPVGVDGRILLFTALVSLSSVLIFGLAPALQVSRPNPKIAIKDEAGTVMILGRRRDLRNCLVVMQVALSVIALTFGGLCIRSLLKVRFKDPGFDHARVLGVSVDFEHEPVKGLDRQQFFANLKKRVETFSGVQAASLSVKVPLASGQNYKTGATHIENYPIPADGASVSWRYVMIGPGYFRTLGIPILRGRDFSAQDRENTARVMIVNELAAEHYWPDQDPIGKCVTLEHGEVRQVVGVVKTVMLGSLRSEPAPFSFWPITQPMKLRDGRFVEVKPVLLVRTKGKSKTVASLLRSELDATGLSPASYDVRTSAEYARHVSTEKRMIIGIVNIVGSVGLLLVATGIFSLMAFEMRKRTREIGIRMALGAQRVDVQRLILRKGTFLTVIGLVLGIGFSPLSLGFVVRVLPANPRTRYGDLLYGVQIWDPLTFVAVALVVTLIALVACWMPAHRASRIDPMEALRYE